MIHDKLHINVFALNVSTKCQRRCERCYGHLNKISGESFMDIQTAKKGAELFMRLVHPEAGGDLLFYGGEPLLNWELIKEFIPWFSEFSKDRNIKMFTSTNGIALNREIIDFHYYNHVGLSVSLDGDFNFHCNKVSKNEFNHIISMMRYGIERDPRLIIPHCVISKRNISETYTILSFLVSLGVKWINLERDLRESWNNNDRQELLNHIRRIVNENDVIIQPYAEGILDCTTCKTKSIMIYPNGDIYDSCYCMASVIVGKGLIKEEDANMLYLGNLNSEYNLKIAERFKRNMIRQNMQCFLIDENVLNSLNQMYPGEYNYKPTFRLERILENEIDNN